MALGAAACGGQQSSAAAPAGDTASVAVSGSGVTVDVITTNSWNGGYNGAVRITNTAFSAPITSFSIVFKLAGNAGVAGSAWNGTISAPDGSGNRTATNPDWLRYQPIGTGSSWDVGFNGSGTFSGSTIVSVTINGQAISIGNPTDTTPPTVSLASSATSVTAAGSITLTGTATDNVGVARVEFYEGTTLLATDTSSPYTAAVAFTSANNGTHSYTAKAFDAAGNSATSSAVTVTVNIGTSTDTTPPTVSLASSATSVTTASTITLTATASDNVGVTRVEFYDGTTLLATDTSSPYSTTVALAAANNGTHSYTARAYDAAGNNRTSTAVTVTVNIQSSDTTPPTVSLASSATSVTTASTITLTATATDNVGVARVEFYEGTTLLATDSASPYTYTIAFTAAANGTHSYTARAYDAAGNNRTSTAVTVTVNIQSSDTTPPTVSLSATPTSITTAGNVTLTATASDNVGVARVEFYDGATLLGSDTTSPYSFLGAMTSANNGTHSFTARAFDAAGNSATSTAVSVVVNIGGGTGSAWRVNSSGRVTKNGTVFPVHCGSWFGLQGRYEIASDSANPRGAPMEQYIGNTFWANGGQGTGRTIAGDYREMKAAGINVVRLPLVHQTLDATDPQGKDFLKNHSSVRIANSRLALETMIKEAANAGVYLLLDIHSCSNYIDWRKGRLDARPPWVDGTRDNYDYKREDCSCAPDGNPSSVTRIQAYNKTLWLQDLKTIAGFNKALGVDAVMGIDIYNEPWDYSWAEWKTLIEDAYTAINSVDTNLLVWAQGISGSNGNQDGTPTTTEKTPHGSLDSNPNWGENLYEAGTNPPNVPKDRLVFSPHTYGPSVAVQPMFMDPSQPECKGLEGDAAAVAKCKMVINATLLRQGWEEHFGYLKDLGYAVIVGEWGGNLDWPKGKSSLRDQQMWGYLPTYSPGIDEQWQNAFTDYMVSKGIESCYWSINPESGDTGGWYSTPYDPNSNTGGWGEWGAFDTRRTALLKKVWNGIP